MVSYNRIKIKIKEIKLKPRKIIYLYRSEAPIHYYIEIVLEYQVCQMEKRNLVGKEALPGI